MLVVVAAQVVVIVLIFMVSVVGSRDDMLNCVVDRHQVEMIVQVVMFVTVVLLPRLSTVHFVPVMAVSAVDVAVLEESCELHIGVSHFLNVVVNIVRVFSSHTVLIASLSLFLLGQQVVRRLQRTNSRLLGLWGWDWCWLWLLFRSSHLGNWASILLLVILLGRSGLSFLFRFLGSGLVNVMGLFGGFKLHQGVVVVVAMVVLLSSDVALGINREEHVSSVAFLVLFTNRCMHFFGDRHEVKRLLALLWPLKLSAFHCRLLFDLLSEGVGNEIFLRDNVVRHCASGVVRILREILLTGVVVLSLRVVALDVLRGVRQWVLVVVDSSLLIKVIVVRV